MKCTAMAGLQLGGSENGSGSDPVRFFTGAARKGGGHHLDINDLRVGVVTRAPPAYQASMTDVRAIDDWTTLRMVKGLSRCRRTYKDEPQG